MLGWFYYELALTTNPNTMGNHIWSDQTTHRPSRSRASIDDFVMGLNKPTLIRSYKIHVPL